MQKRHGRASEAADSVGELLGTAENNGPATTVRDANGSLERLGDEIARPGAGRDSPNVGEGGVQMCLQACGPCLASHPQGPHRSHQKTPGVRRPGLVRPRRDDGLRR